LSGAVAWGNVFGTLSNQTDLQTELNLKSTVVDLDTHTSDVSNPHSVTQTQVVLSNVDNTSDVDKPISTAQAAANLLKLNLTGGTVNGQVKGITPTSDEDFTRKDYVDTVSSSRNVIINGNFDVWQRGTSFPALVTTNFTADRFSYNKVGVMVHTVSQSANVPSYAQSGHISNYSYRLEVTTADTSIDASDHCVINNKIEGYDYARIAGGNATLSFWVKGAKTGIHCVAFRNTGADRTYVAEYTINTINIWQKIIITIPLTETGGTWDYTNGKGLEIRFALAVGTDFQTTADAWQTGNYMGTASQVNECDSAANTFRIAQVQFEKGSVATPFEFKNYADELAKCQRYYARNTTESLSTRKGLYSTSATLTSFVDGANIVFPVAMREIPTMTFHNTEGGTAGTWSIYISSAWVSATMNTDYTTTTGICVRLLSTVVQNNAYTASGNWEADAEI